MTPVLVTPPAGELVELDALKMQCRITGTREDTLLAGYLAAANGWLDGWAGLLGRAILPQVWAIEAPASGVFRLPMPDVTTAAADYGDGALPLDLMPYSGGVAVEVAGACRIEFTCEMPASRRAVAAQAVLMLAAHWYANREAVGIASIEELPFGVRALVQQLRWRRV